MEVKAVSKSFFVRDATGLVRELSWFDTFLCAFGILNVGLGLVQAFAYAPFVFPGGNIPIAFIIAIPGAFFLGLLNALFTAAMPAREGTMSGSAARSPRCSGSPSISSSPSA